MLHNHTFIPRDNRALTDDEVRSVKLGDLLLEGEQWCRIETLSWSVSVCGWPLANVHAVGVEHPLLSASLTISRAMPARRIRFQ
jgi:hypothetical protein